MTPDTHTFDDAGLKEAVRQLRGGHRARPELRELVMRRLTEARDAQPVTDSASGPSAAEDDTAPARPLRLPSSSQQPASFRIRTWVAMAATVAICVRGAATFVHYRNAQQAGEAQEAYAKNDELLDAMIDAHKEARES